MKYFEIISIVLGHLFMIVLIIILINEIRETKKMKAEREKCFSMISRCSQLLRIWETNVYLTDTDFNFLKHRIYKDYIRIHEMPLKIPSSEEERLILAEGMHWISTLGERWNTRNKEANHKSGSCPYEKVPNMAVAGFAGFSINKNTHEDLEWIYYMWLMGVLMRAVHSRKSIDWEELKRLCVRVEKWTANYKMDSQYLKNKIRECKSQIDRQRK